MFLKDATTFLVNFKGSLTMAQEGRLLRVASCGVSGDAAARMTIRLVHQAAKGNIIDNWASVLFRNGMKKVSHGAPYVSTMRGTFRDGGSEVGMWRVAR